MTSVGGELALQPPGPEVPPAARRRHDLLLIAAIVWLGVVVFFAVTADLLPLKGVSEPAGAPKLRPGWRWPELLGTDEFGRSLLTRVAHGARVSLVVGLLSTALAMFVGGVIGSIAGYFGRRVDAAINLLLDATLAFPALVFLLFFGTVFSPSIPTLVMAIGLVSIPHFARLARANTIRVAASEHVIAARLMGARHARILLREVMTNVMVPVASYAFVVVATIIIVEGSLSFLGLGIPPPAPSWGGMIASGRKHLRTDPYLVFVPAGALLLTVISLNAVGDHARRRFDLHAEDR